LIFCCSCVSVLCFSVVDWFFMAIIVFWLFSFSSNIVFRLCLYPFSLELFEFSLIFAVVTC